MAGFSDALRRFSSDETFRNQAINAPEKVNQEFPDLTLDELAGLRSAARLSGVDMTAIDASANPSGGITADACCCSCCCCGEAGSVTISSAN